jgi:hypothetical protein
MATQRPKIAEIAPPDDPFKRQTVRGTISPYTRVLQTSDTVLRQKGGIENLTIYRELLRDDQVGAAWMQRRLALTSAETVIEPGADDPASKAAAEELQLEIDGLGWDNITDKMLYSIFYGWGVAEVLWKADGARIRFADIKVRDRARFRFDIDRKLYLWRAGRFELMPERKFWTISAGWDHDDEPYGLGIAHSLYWPVFFKRNDVKFWLIFLEKFGQPTAMARLPAGQIDDEEKVNKAVELLHNISTDAGVVVPEDVVIELLEAARTGSADYGAMHQAMNGAIAKIIIGQTATTEGTPGKLGADDTQGDVAQAIVEADADLICETFNRGPVQWWSEWNFPRATPPRVYRQTEPPEDLAHRAERDGKIFALGYEPTEDYVREHYGDGWQKKSAPAGGFGGFGGLFGAGADDEESDFSERERLALTALKVARRGDQQALVEAARRFAEQYDTINGRRIDQILQAAEFSDDPDLFRRRLDDILAENPAPEAIDKLTRAGVFARMLGALRVQRG